ncbi:hypothetical protein SLEP1_g30963 [Rubroshorea leprosula]|uniref:Uncharacterized protein n=1 Tax=Rubroshorea leprosula TaxID=152421 RepID=A0AAV5K1Y1_9ROSI|nr:hypothetical protein SLEP1_g30963 [Rubroshorea leprosula]
MKARAAATKAEMSHVKEEKAQMIASVEDMKLLLDLMKASLHQQFDDMLLVSEVVNSLTQIFILQL